MDPSDAGVFLFFWVREDFKSFLEFIHVGRGDDATYMLIMRARQTRRVSMSTDR
jgi:hypothetical protein